jgi:EAL domain-containing protein (putative c-di-GMP-specific phosphodiesterase class I)
MYTAKSSGKNRIEVFEAGMHAAVVSRLALRGDLELALKRDQLFLLYQPVVRLKGQEVVGVEALLRWNHPERGVVGPVEFISIAEESGAIVPIGRWVLEQACRQALAWDQTSPERRLTMSVNVSGRQIAERGFVDEVRRVLDDTGIEPGRLILELTEGVLMQDTEATLATLVDLKKLGVRLAIDDFGTGHSSLTWLRRLPADFLKVDRTFVAGLGTNPSDTAIVRAVLDLGRALGLITVAEGVETPEQLALLRDLGCDLAQGYHLARPGPSETVTRLLKEGTRW